MPPKRKQAPGNVKAQTDKDRKFGVRKARKAKVFLAERAEDYIEDGFPTDWDWEECKSFLLKRGVVGPKTDLKLLHGDLIFLHSYRGCGAYIAFENEDHSITLIKTLGEMGYMAPPHFADAPRGYFSSASDTIDQQLIFLDYMDPDTDAGKLLLETIDEIKESKTYVNETDWFEGDVTINEDFPKGYAAVYFGAQLAILGDFKGIDLEHFEEESFISKYSKQFRESPAFRKQTLSMLQVVMKGSGLPDEVLGVISEFVVAPPVPQQNSVGPAPAAKKRKRKVDDDDDGDWCEPKSKKPNKG